MHRILPDLKLVFRQLRKAPGFAATAVLMLAFGIGATTAISSAIQAIAALIPYGLKPPVVPAAATSKATRNAVRKTAHARRHSSPTRRAFDVDRQIAARKATLRTANALFIERPTRPSPHLPTPAP